MSDIKIFTHNIEQEAVDQIQKLSEQPAFADSKIRIMPDVHAGVAGPIGFTGTYTNKIIPNVTGVDLSCLDGETEFITEKGFKKISEYEKGDKVLQYEPKTDEASFVEPYAYISQPCNKFYHFINSKGLDQMVSEEHRMLVFQGTKGRGYTKKVYHPKELMQRSLNKGYYSFKASYKINNPGINLTDNQLRLRIALCADGNIRKNENTGHNSFRFHFTKERKIQRIQELLNKENINYSLKKYDNGSTEISFYFYDKDLLPWMYKTMDDLYLANYHQLEIISEEVLLWDGSIDEKRNHKHFDSTNKKFADFIQFVYSGIDIRAGISYKDFENENHSRRYIVTPTLNNYVGYCQPQIIEKEGMKKYCFIVPSSYFVARRNGKIFITGNCGMFVYELGNIDIDLQVLDEVVVKNFNLQPGEARKYAWTAFDFSRLRMYEYLRKEDYLLHSIGTVGTKNSNHFIELNKDDEGNLYLVVHSGSRNLGIQVANYYQQLAAIYCAQQQNSLEKMSKQLIEDYKEQGRQKEIQLALQQLKEQYNHIETYYNRELAYIEGEIMQNYLHDVEICKEYAHLNRTAVLEIILRDYGLQIGKAIRPIGAFETLHNYVDVEHKIIRKGAIAAYQGQKALIPLNMRDGSLIVVGKGNEDWNCSAPHGAGRQLSRSKAREQLSIEDYRDSMKHVYTTSVMEATIDEAPMAYKPADEIIQLIQDTVEVKKHIKPIYNFKVR